MAVRFVPVEPEPKAQPGRDRENLAEVIELRAKIAEVEVARETNYTEVLTSATKILARKAMSSGELREALERFEYAAHHIDEVIASFERRHFLDDDALAVAITEKLRRTKQASKQQISRKLLERRIGRDAIDRALATLEAEDETEVMREVAADRARRLSSLDRVTAERRLAGFMQRRGWGGSHMMQIVREALDAENK